MCEKTCSLHHNEPENFDRSQWCPPNVVSGYYVLYRLTMALLFSSVIVVFIYIQLNDGKFFIFLTNEGLLFLTFHFVIEAVLVLKRWAWEKLHSKHINCKHLPRMNLTLSGIFAIWLYLQITRLTHLVRFTNYHGLCNRLPSQ